MLVSPPKRVLEPGFNQAATRFLSILLKISSYVMKTILIGRHGEGLKKKILVDLYLNKNTCTLLFIDIRDAANKSDHGIRQVKDGAHQFVESSCSKNNHSSIIQTTSHSPSQFPNTQIHLLDNPAPPSLYSSSSASPGCPSSSQVVDTLATQDL